MTIPKRNKRKGGVAQIVERDPYKVDVDDASSSAIIFKEFGRAPHIPPLPKWWWFHWTCFGRKWVAREGRRNEFGQGCNKLVRIERRMPESEVRAIARLLADGCESTYETLVEMARRLGAIMSVEQEEEEAKDVCD